MVVVVVGSPVNKRISFSRPHPIEKELHIETLTALQSLPIPTGLYLFPARPRRFPPVRTRSRPSLPVVEWWWDGGAVVVG